MNEHMRSAYQGSPGRQGAGIVSLISGLPHRATRSGAMMNE
jgi:hypothetical protein